MFAETQQPCVRFFQEPSKYTVSKIILFHGKGLNDQSDMSLPQSKNQVGEGEHNISVFFVFFFQDCLCIYFLLRCLGSTHSYRFQVRLQ